LHRTNMDDGRYVLSGAGDDRRTDCEAHPRDEATHQARPDDIEGADVIDRHDGLPESGAHGRREALPGSGTHAIRQGKPRAAHSPMTLAIFCPSRIILRSVLRGSALTESYQLVSVWKKSSCAAMRSRTSGGVSSSSSRAAAHSRRNDTVGSISRR